ncbi:MAG: MBL fold metallo-hydrolase [Candidatus Hodarchaeales archaeon]|jgi:ribonuclease BN (tRNA processing enzyme)
MKHEVLYSVAGIATQILVSDENFLVLLDIGDGILRDIVERVKTFPFRRPIHIFITHGHYDHCGGLYSFLGFLRMLAHKHPVCVYSPEGGDEVQAILKSFLSVQKSSLSYPLENIRLSPGDKVKISAQVEIESYQMQHRGSIIRVGALLPIPSLGYAIYYNKEKWVAYTGDTGYHRNTELLVDNASFAYIEATNEKGESNSYHLTLDEAHKLGRLAKNYRLIHKRYESR